MGNDDDQILVVNTGSSSLKAALFDRGGDLGVVWTVLAEGLGRPGSRLVVCCPDGQRDEIGESSSFDHAGAVGMLARWLDERDQLRRIGAVGHRVVHGGRDLTAPVLVDDVVLTELRALIPIDPEHLPQAIAAIEATGGAIPAAPQVACFDTAFHRPMPAVARRYPLPRRFEGEGIVRYGFHGLSYESIVARLRAEGDARAGGRLVVAHLGSGASMAAVRDGRPVDTTMGFSPTGGLMMGTRSGDLDPGVLLHLLRSHGLDADALSRLVNRESGLLGVSGISADMRDLLAREADDPAAADAVALFCYSATKALGALVAILGGLDTLVFTGGIGEHAAPIRERVCAGLAYLGIELDPGRNDQGAPVVSRDGARVTVSVMRTEEELMIARHTVRLVESGGTHVSV